jgi:phage FluMu gp28-like protein
MRRQRRLKVSGAETGTEYAIKQGPLLMSFITHLLSYSDSKPFLGDWWQNFYLKDTSRFFIANKSRRVGWSYITAAKGLGMALDPARSGYTKQYVSYSLDDAVEKIRIAAEFFDSIPELARPKKIISRTKTRLEFLDLNGRSVSRLISLPCKQPRGKGGDISLDEFAFHAKDDEIYTAALPIISRGGNLEIGSTPFGNKGKFYEIYNDFDRYSTYKRYNIPWYFSPALCTDVKAAVKARDMTIEERVAAFGSEILREIFRSIAFDDFRQEYECFYRDEQAAFITLEMIRACTPLGGGEEDEDTQEVVPFRDLDSFALAYDPETHGSLYAGYDVGRTNDASELILIGYKPRENTKTVLGLITKRKCGFDEQEDLLCRCLTQLPVHRLCIDSTGIGMDLAERMSKKYPLKVEGCTFTNEFKEDISNAMWIGFNRLEFRLPADKELASQIHAIRKIVTLGKHARFDSDRNQKHHCYDDKTEVLTGKGWKLFRDLDDSDTVAVLGKDGRMWMERPSDRQVYDHDGDMVRIKNKQIDLLVTPDHRMYVSYPTRTDGFDFVPASALLDNSLRWKFKKNAGDWNGDDNPRVPMGSPEDFARLVGWYLSEGCHSGDGKGIVLYQKKNHVLDDMIQGAKRFSRAVHVYDTNNGVKRIEFKATKIAGWLGEKKKCYEKRIPRECFGWSRRLLGILLGAMLQGDGAYGAGKTWTYWTTSKGLADDVSELLVRIGWSGSITEQIMRGKGWNKRGLYRVNINVERNEPIINKREKSVCVEQYVGKVYCVTTSTHTLYVRRNNVPCWSGNCDKYWAMALANHAIASGPAATRGKFYQQYRASKEAGADKPRGKTPQAVLSGMYRLYRPK